MALTLVSSFKNQTTASTTNTSNSVSTAVDDWVIVSYCVEDNTFAGSLTISNTGTALTWTNIATTNTANNTKCAAWRAKVATAGNITVTVTAAAALISELCVDVYTGAHATTPVPAGNVFSGVSGTDISQSITPTATGSMLRMVAGDWGAGNTFAAIANCTIDSTIHDPARMTACFIRPTTQPLGTGAFSIGETDTGGTIAWIAFEVQAAAGGSNQTLIDSLFTNTNTFFSDVIVGGVQNPRLDARWNNFSDRGFAWDHFWQDAEAVSVNTNGGIMVQWEPSADPNVTGYFVYWDTVSHAGGVYTDYPNSVDVTGAGADQTLLTDLIVGQIYYINISSHGAGGHDANESALWGEITDTASDLGLWQFLVDGLRFENQNTFFSDTIVLGGGALSASFVESAATSDSQTAVLSAAVNRTETAATGDSQTAALSASVTRTESAETSDSQTAALSASATATDATATGNSQTASLSAAVNRAETAATSDSQTAFNGGIMVQWEPSADPNVTGYFVYWDTVSHAGGVYTDYPNSVDVTGAGADQTLITSLLVGQTYFINISSHGAGGHDADESALWGEITDTASDLGLWQFLIDGLRFENQNTFFSDTIVTGGVFSASFSDTTATGDSQTAALSASATATDTVATSDTGAASLGGGTFIVSFGDSAATADSQTAALSASVTRTEAAATGDSQNAGLSSSATATDTVATSDTSAASLGGGTFIVSFGDSAATTDIQAAGLTASASVTETTATGESISGGNGLSASRTESAIISDSATGGLSAVVTFGETLTVLDSQPATLAALVAASDIVVSGDSLAAINSKISQFADSVIAGDTISASLSTQIIPTLDWSRYSITVKSHINCLVTANAYHGDPVAAKSKTIRIHL